MWIRVAFIGTGLITVHILSAKLHAASTRIEPFIGAVQESWESFPNVNSTLETQGQRTYLHGPIRIFQEFGTILHPKMGIYEPGSANYRLGSSGNAQVADGEKGMGLAVTGPQINPEFIEPASITFDRPVISFGAYWAAGTDDLFDPEVIEFKFYNAAETLVGTDTWSYSRSFLINEPEMIFSGDGLLQWLGWQFFIPIKRIEFGGGAIVADFLQANPIPEPSSVALIGATVLLIGFASKNLCVQRR
jgi:hypothetical protein